MPCKEDGDMTYHLPMPFQVHDKSKCLQNLNNIQQISQPFSYTVNSPTGKVKERIERAKMVCRETENFMVGSTLLIVGY